MAITALTSLAADRAEYSRYETDTPDGDRSKIILTAGGVATDGDPAYFVVRHARTGRPVMRAGALFAANVARCVLSLDSDAYDADGIYRAVQGDYTLTVQDADTTYLDDGDPLTLAPVAVTHTYTAPNRIRIAIATAAAFESLHLGGIDLAHRAAKLVPTIQGLTGVTGVDALGGVAWGGYPLRYDATNLTLSFNRGPATPIDTTAPTTTPRDLQLWNETLDGMIAVRVTRADLPGTAKDAYAFVNYKMTDADAMRRYLDDAYAAWQTLLMGTSIEPRQVATPLLAPLYPYADSKAWGAEPWRNAKSVTRGAEIELGARNVLKIHALSGFYNASRVLNMPDSWIVCDRENGVVNFVPSFDAQYPASPVLAGVSGGYGGFYGALADHIEGFWQMAFSYGLQSLWDGPAALVRTGIMHTAAIQALLVAGRAAQGPLSSESFSRDGISLSKAYTGGQMGLYSDRIAGSQAWLDANIPAIRRAIIGLTSIA